MWAHNCIYISALQTNALKFSILNFVYVFPDSNSVLDYRKFPKYSDTQNICCNHSKSWTMWLYHRVMSPNDAGEMANSVDPDQTAPPAVWSGSGLFAQAYLSENLGSLRYSSIATFLHVSPYFSRQKKIECIFAIDTETYSVDQTNNWWTYEYDSTRIAVQTLYLTFVGNTLGVPCY